MLKSSSIPVALPLIAVLLFTVANPGLSQEAPPVPSAAASTEAQPSGIVDLRHLRDEIAAIDAEISSAEADIKNYEAGLVVVLTQARLETLKLTRAILQNRIAAAEGDVETDVTVLVGVPDEDRAAELLVEIENQMKVIEDAEQEAKNTGGLVAALALSRVLTEKMNLSILRGSWMSAKYGAVLPVELAASFTPPARDAEITDTPADDAGEIEQVNIPEWADPKHPEIDYTKKMFADFHGEGYELHGWWAMKEMQAAIDDTRSIFAVNISEYKEGLMPTNASLFISCREGTPSIIYDVDEFLIGDFSSDTMQTTYRIDSEDAVTSSWSKVTSNEGTGLFGGRGVALMRDIYDAEKIFFRTVDRGEQHDATFQLAGVQPVIEAAAAACSFSLLDLSNDDYRAIQTMLNAAGFDAGTPDGVWGKGSAEAMRQWQEENGLTPSGAPDRASLEAMGITEVSN